MEVVEVKLYDLSSTIQPANAFVLVLKEINGTRKLPIIIGPIEAESIKIALRGVVPRRPLTHDLFTSLINTLEVTLKKVLIYYVDEGIYYSYLIFEKDGNVFKLDARTSDAVALAIKNNAPIFTTSQIIENEHLREETNGSFSISVNLVGMSVLKDELEKAIKCENYEQASRLRDEIRRREEKKYRNNK